MCTESFSKIYSNIKKEEIWNLLTNVTAWPKWNSNLEYCKMTESFRVGSGMKVKPKWGNSIEAILTEVEKETKFVTCATYFGAKIYFSHILEENLEGLRITHTLTVIGPLKWLWFMLIGKKIANSVITETDNLVEYAKAKSL